MSSSAAPSRSLVSRTKRPRSLPALVLGLLAAMTAALLLAPGAADAAQSTTYQATIVIPVPPASTFQGSGGGDGWGLAMTPAAVYNVFHHQGSLQVACHLQTDASQCWPAKTITDGSGHGFASQGDPGLYLDQASGHLFVFATRTSDQTGGVVCIDTTQPAANTDPFCGFTQLSGVGEATTSSVISTISAPALVGSKWYAFNYVSGAGPASGTAHTQNTMLCFDTATDAACTGQPFAFTTTGTTLSNDTYPAPPVTAVGGRVVVPLTVDSTQELACFDPATGAACTGSWPVVTTSASGIGAAFPLLSGTGTTLGFCLPTSTDPCFGLNGASVPTPANLTTVVTGGSPWNGPAITIGARVYVPEGGADKVACFDYSSNQGCANFPKTFANLDYLYTVNPDPQRPSCLWVNADGGTGQIQNFDAFTGGQCGQGPTRVLASSFVVPTQVCAPTSWDSIQVTDPAPAAYTSGTVDFRDVSGNSIPGVAQQGLDGTGSSNLHGVNLTGSLPQFLLTLNGLPAVPTSVTVKLTWTATYDPSCTTSVVKAGAPPTPTGTPATSPFTRHQVSGGGTTDEGRHLSFWFSAQARPSGRFGGQLSAVTDGHHFHAPRITGLSVSAPTATWTGVGRWDGRPGYTFTATAFDHGRGGGEHSRRHDRFSLTVTSPSGSVVLRAGGALTEGNVTVR